MWLMAGIASNASGVIGAHDLWKGFRLGGVGFMTVGADDGRVEFWRLH